jgi:hypothetical protein
MAFPGRGGFRGHPVPPPGHVFISSHNRHFHHRNFFPFNNNCFGAFSPFCNNFGFGAGNFFLGAPFYGASYPLFPEDYYVPPYGMPQQAVSYPSDNGNAQLALEVQRLSDQIADMRDEQARQHAEFRQPPPPPPGTSLSVQQPAGATTFVFRDGRRVTVQNYAITGQTLWILSEHAAKKMSVTDLDRSATEQVNAANGVELRLPPTK